SADHIERMVRAYDPWPGARTVFGDSWLRVHEATPVASDDGRTGGAGAKAGTVVGVDSERGILVQTGDGLLGMLRLQMAARKALAWKDFLNGVGMPVGTVFRTQEN
ncbi:MAG: methionyl-tRNA formyltransferase, partial [Spirochaetaceae bacterium]